MSTLTPPPASTAATTAIRPAVVIPLYKPELSPAERLSVDRSIEALPGRELFLVGPERLAAHLRSQCEQRASRLQFKSYDDRYFAGIKGYNALMRSKAFYESFAGFSHILIAQTDALVVSDQLDLWCARPHSYIGAPWFVGGAEPTLPLRFAGVGNGGFSLRRVSDFLQVLNSPTRRIPNFIKSREGGSSAWEQAVRRLKHEWLLAYNVEPLFPTSNEDVFWGALVPAVFPFFRVPTPEEAIGFAFEVAPRLMYEMNGHRLPFGCHAWERFDREFWIEQLAFLSAAPRPG
jgi:hypothetical protein